MKLDAGGGGREQSGLMEWAARSGSVESMNKPI